MLDDKYKTTGENDDPILTRQLSNFVLFRSLMTSTASLEDKVGENIAKVASNVDKVANSVLDDLTASRGGLEERVG